ncbi:Swarming motility ybiA [Brachionus plicatilis]|uniref:Swarming motility ybiA n=1 Tax=Brachionus plicatilis TaxID=10195 RepID=A0A3M7T126_BRAPC|nr:Swarming motility ybiA [Brachionus plicatilis]
MPILFYSAKSEPYGCFSNFSDHQFELDGHKWKTSEHYFQAQKFCGTKYFSDVLNAPSPRKAANLGRNRSFPLRKDWEEVKEDVMRNALYAKFSQNESIRKVLLSTGDEQIIENSPIDFYWGCGSDNSGKNRLGHLLTELRDKLKN